MDKHFFSYDFIHIIDPQAVEKNPCWHYQIFPADVTMTSSMVLCSSPSGAQGALYQRGPLEVN